jgi:hypothetical protein
VPNLVDNVMAVTGPESDIALFLRRCFSVWEPDGEPELDFDRIIPLPSDDECAIPYWGTSRNALDTAFMEKRPDSLVIWISTASSTPDPIYLELGKLYPSLRFSILAADPGNGWAATIQVRGQDAVLDQDADFPMVYEQMYGNPPPNFEPQEVD